MTMTAMILLTFGAAALAPLAHRLARGAAGWVLALAPAAIFAGLLGRVGAVGSGAVLQEGWEWIPSLGVRFSFYLDGLSLLFALLISGIGVLVTIYAGGYLAGHRDLGRFYVYLFLFMGAMLGLVLADNLIALFVFWELTSISSFLLIGYYHDKEESRRSALQALLITGAGGLALLAGLILLAHIGGSMELSVLLAGDGAVREHPLYLAVLLLVLVGAFSKSAQTPLHFWLPGAMAAPAPVSAYLHSATMVKAGVYLLARLHPVLGYTVEWHYLVTLAGAVTMVTGGLLAVAQTDLKRLLAYSTVSALGTLVMLVGLGTELAAKAAMIFLLVHSLYKGALFMAAGTLDHETGTRDVRQLSGLWKAMPVTAVAAGLAALSMTGFPPLLGFIGKEIMYEAKLQAPTAAPLILLAGVLANVINVTVAGIVGIRPFIGPRSETPRPAHEAPAALWLGPLLMGAAGLLLGLAPGLAGGIIEPAVGAVRGEAVAIKLKLWHGFNLVFLLSVLTVFLGIVLFAVRRPLRRLARRLAPLAEWTPSRAYAGMWTGILAGAGAVTRVLQNGHLRYYFITVLSVFAALVGYQLLVIGAWPEAIGLANSQFYEIGLAVVMLLATMLVLVTRSRLAAVAALGVVGYGVALIYVFYGAPDLAITQILVETLTVILFILVVYHLPRFAEYSPLRSRIRDAVIAVVSGGLMTVLALKAASIQFRPTISGFFGENSVPEAFGRNVVNVILVDFRALDTLGEITVLAVAAIGVYALLKLTPDRKEPRQ